MKHRLTWVEVAPFEFRASKPGVRYSVECTNPTNPAGGWWEAFCVETGDTIWGKLHVDYKANACEAMALCEQHYFTRRSKDGN
jgi:hypothetical protein